jgi:hypothetical protein
VIASTRSTPDPTRSIRHFICIPHLFRPIIFRAFRAWSSNGERHSCVRLRLHLATSRKLNLFAHFTNDAHYTIIFANLAFLFFLVQLRQKSPSSTTQDEWIEWPPHSLVRIHNEQPCITSTVKYIVNSPNNRLPLRTHEIRTIITINSLHRTTKRRRMRCSRAK